MTFLRSSVIVMPAAATSHLPVLRSCTGLDALERRVDDRLLDAQLLGDQVDHVDVEADDLAVLVELERLVGQVGADGQRARLDDLGAPCDLGLVASGGAPAEGEREGGDGGQVPCETRSHAFYPRQHRAQRRNPAAPETKAHPSGGLDSVARRERISPSVLVHSRCRPPGRGRGRSLGGWCPDSSPLDGRRLPPRCRGTAIGRL